MALIFRLAVGVQDLIEITRWDHPHVVEMRDSSMDNHTPGVVVQEVEMVNQGKQAMVPLGQYCCDILYTYAHHARLANF
jgi:hypothetical protein